MNKELQQQIFSRLDALAQKLNIAGGQIWQFYVAQARVEAITDVISAVILLAACITCIWMATKCIRRLLTGKYKDETGWVFGVIGAITGAAITGGMFLPAMTAALTALLNPNYWAFQQLISTIMGGH